MSLNNIQLTPQLLTNLYQNVLVETKMAKVPALPPINFLGGNKKQILIVAANADTPFLTDNELTFLTNILAACKLGLDDVAIINKEHLPTVNYETIIEMLQSKIVLLFNIDPLAFGLPIHFPHFQVQQFNSRVYLCAPSLNDIEQEKTLKAKLWAGLKTLFQL